jgi:hypothetical protein
MDLKNTFKKSVNRIQALTDFPIVGIGDLPLKLGTEHRAAWRSIEIGSGCRTVTTLVEAGVNEHG